MNIDFSDRPGFSIYVILLMLAGLVLIAFASPGFVRASTLRRVLNLVVGLGFLGYGFYLAFIFSGGHYFIFFYAFLAPIVLIARTLRGSTPKRRVAPAGPHPAGQYPGAQYPGAQYPGAQYPGALYPAQYPGGQYPAQYPGAPYPQQYPAAPYPSAQPPYPVAPQQQFAPSPAAPPPPAATETMPVWPPAP
jgi:hypothetical protein